YGVGALEVQARRELADEVRGKGRVEPEGVVVAARLRLAAEAVRVCAEACVAEEETLLLREVAEGREVERVVDRRPPRDLARVEGGRDLVVDAVVERLRQEEVLALLRVKRAEEPELVLLDRAADVEAGVHLGEAVRGRAGERDGRGLHGADEARRREIDEGVAADGVRAALCDDVEDAARGVAEVSAVSAGLHRA